MKSVKIGSLAELWNSLRTKEGFLRKTVKSLLIIILASVILFSLVFFLSIPRMPSDYAQERKTSSFEGLNLITHHEMDETGRLIVRTSGGNEWSSNIPPEVAKNDEIAKGIERMSMMSPVTIRYINKDNSITLATSYANALNNGKTKPTIERNGNKYKVIYNFVTGKATDGLYIQIPIEYEVNKGAVVVTVLNNEIKENAEYRLLDISLTPYFGAASPEDKGYVLIPDGSGALMDFDNQSVRKQYSQSVYGRDSSLKLKMKTDNTSDVLMPVYGIKKEKQSTLAIVDEGDALATLTVNPKGFSTSYGNAYFTFRYREYDTITLSEMSWNERSLPYVSKESASNEVFRVKYFLLDGDSDYVDMALLHRQYLADKYDFKGKSNNSSVPLNLTVNMSVRKIKPVLGLPVEVVETLTTFDQLNTMIEDLTNAGIDNVIVNVKGWQKGGPYGKVQNKIDFESKVGNSKDLRKLIQKTESKANVYLSNDFVNGYKNGNGFISIVQGNRDVTGALSLQYEYLVSTGTKDLTKASWSLLTPSYSTGLFQKYLKSFEKLKEKVPVGISVEGYGNTLYADMYNTVLGDIAGRQVSTRQRTLRMWQSSLEQAKTKIGTVLVDGGMQYVLPFSDVVQNIPLNSSNLRQETRSVPYYQIVAGGFSTLVSTPVNFTTDPDNFYLKCLETGVYPLYSLFAEESSAIKNTKLKSIYNGNYEVWFDTIVKNYQKFHEAYQKIGNAVITDHQQTDDKVYMTTYENGTSILVDYNNKTFQVLEKGGQ